MYKSTRSLISCLKVSLPIRLIPYLWLWNVLLFWNTFAEDYVIQTVLVPSIPSVNSDKKIVYELDLIFAKCPPDYWINYNKKKGKLIVDFYGINIIGNPTVNLSGKGIFKKITIQNSETKLSLTGKGCKVFIDVQSDQGWHFLAHSINTTTIRVTTWKDISNVSLAHNKRRPMLAYALLGSAIFLVSLAGIAIVTNID